jgi:hypothetical protein
MEDIPTPFNTKEFALLRRPNTPRLLIDSIRRGDEESGLFEGDIISMNGEDWLICYERGFYAINKDYIIRYLYTLSDYKYLGTCFDIKSPIPINFRSRHRFIYKDLIFRINDIVGAYDDKLLLRPVSKPVNVAEVHQECCITYNKQRIYLNDSIDDGIVELHGGRVTLNKDNNLIDLATGGSLDGYIPKPTR